MESDKFKKILFKTAFCSMSCDGHIDDKEIEELRKIDRDTSYFKKIDLSNELKKLIKDIKSDSKKVLTEYFKTVKSSNFTIIQELLIIEIVIRIIASDGKIDENETKFLNLLRSKLDINDQLIFERFGKSKFFKNINFNPIKDVSNNITNDFIENINFSDLSLTNSNISK
ncbi:MAG: hypothetical protein CMG00_06425 [Candidatus Marinimicrobia bacterium]|nr:hypothetical protein [Candidatus Neomarinimicrobiota bacterium]